MLRPRRVSTSSGKISLPELAILVGLLERLLIDNIHRLRRLQTGRGVKNPSTQGCKGLFACFRFQLWCYLSEEENPADKIHPHKERKSSSERVFLNNFPWVSDSCNRDEGKSSCELFGKVRANVGPDVMQSGFGVNF